MLKLITRPDKRNQKDGAPRCTRLIGFLLPNGLYSVLSGEIRLIANLISGRQMLVHRLTIGNWFGEVSTVDGGPRPQDVISFGQSRILHIPSHTFQKVTRDHPEIFWDIARLLAQRQREAVQFAGMTVSLPVTTRLSRLLLAALDKGHDLNTPAGRSVTLTQGDLATALGVSRQTTNKLLRSLERDGTLSLGYGRLVVLNQAKLRKAAKHF